MDRKYTRGVREDNDQFVDTNVGRGRRISIDVEDANQYRTRSTDTKISIDAETGDRMFLETLSELLSV